MNSFVKVNECEALRSQSSMMGAKNNIYQRPVNGRRPAYAEQPSFPNVFSQRPAFEYRKPIMTKTPYVNNANRSVETTSWRVEKPKNEEIQLSTCKDAWVPPCMKAKMTSDSTSDTNAQANEIRKKLMSILNKISPENMIMLTDSITSLPISTDEHLKTIIELLFQKAIDEPSFTPQYAYICTVLNEKKDKSEKKGSKTSFKKLLTKCCKDRFELMNIHEKKLAKLLEEINHSSDQDVKQKLQSEYDQDELVHRKKSVGNCRFMCELYKVQIITNGTLESCIKHLLKSPKEETLECACNILKHAGQTLNSNVAFEKLNEYSSSAYKTKISTRIRFMILDIIELKENNWVPRSSRVKPELQPNKIHSNVGKSEHKPSTHVQYKHAVLPTVADHENINLLKRADTRDFNKSPSAICVTDVVKSKNPWVLPWVSSETSKTNPSQTLDTKEQEPQVKFRNILNNISPENMASSAKIVTSLPIETDASLINIVEILFQKALDEPSLSPQYAQLCSAMKSMEIKSADCEKTTTSFRKLLIKMCQETFESMYNRKSTVAKNQKEIESCKDKKIRKELQLKFDNDETVHRRRSVANCRFICELLKVNILVPPIIEMCLAKLIQSPKELSLECVCVILQHVGSTINHSGVLEKLQEHSTALKPNFSPSLRSTVMDTIELMNTIATQPNNICGDPPLATRRK